MKRIFPLLILAIIPSLVKVQASEDTDNETLNLAEAWNERMKKEGALGTFGITNDGAGIYFTGGYPPAWAIEHILDAIGIVKGYGTGGINPFVAYQSEEFFQSPLSLYYIKRGYEKGTWEQNDDGEDVLVMGSALLKNAKDKLGPTLFKDMHDEEMEDRRAERFWERFFQNIIPNMIKTFSQRKTILLAFITVLTFIGVPMLIWNFSKAIANALFARRPQILGEKDTDIPKSFIKRLFWKYPAMPEVITNAALMRKLNHLIKMNRKITSHNHKNRSWFRQNKKMPYPHILTYGERGTGKTLFAKQLSRKSGMHFIYLTVADLSQLSEEEALETLKKYFKYARAHAPCIFILDEVDTLFAASDTKSKKLALLFQREFSRSVDEDIQLFFITNYPWLLPQPILNRIYYKIFFDRPTYPTQKRLFELHLKRAFNLKKIPWNSANPYLDRLTEELCKGLVGRDIEAIAITLSLAEDRSPRAFIQHIQNFKKGDEAMENFRENMEEAPKSTPTLTPLPLPKYPKTTPQKEKKKTARQPQKRPHKKTLLG